MDVGHDKPLEPKTWQLHHQVKSAADPAKPIKQPDERNGRSNFFHLPLKTTASINLKSSINQIATDLAC